MTKLVSLQTRSVVAGILGFLSETGRTNLLASVAQDLEHVVDKTKHADHITIVSCVPLAREQLNSLRGIVSKFLKQELPAVNTIDKQVLGGFIIKFGDFFLDASLATELTRVKRLVFS